MTCATNGCKYGVFRDHLCAPCYHRAEQQREDLIRRKAAAFDRLERLAKRGMVVIEHEACESTLLAAVEAMEERG